MTQDWRGHVALLLGCTIGASVLIGALLVGDSMRGSLLSMTQKRLGEIDFALVGDRFFTQELAGKLVAVTHPDTATHEPDPSSSVGAHLNPDSPAEPIRAAAGILLVRASVQSADGTVATPVNVIGTTAEFWRLFPLPAHYAPSDLEDEFLVNEPLAEELGLEHGSRIVARLQEGSAIPREGLMGSRDELARNLPITIDRVVSAEAGGYFQLETTQRVPLNLYVPIETLAKTINQPGRANVLLVSLFPHARVELAADPHGLEAEIEEEFARALSLEDYGLSVHTDDKLGYAWVEDRSGVFSDLLTERLLSVAHGLSARTQRVMSYLANTILYGSREIPYSVVAGIENESQAPLGPMPLVPEALPAPAKDKGQPAPLEGERVYVNQWTADQLKLEPNATFYLDYFRVQEDGTLRSKRSPPLQLAGIVKMDGLGADQHFTPEYPGITDADTFNDWDPPFPVDLNRVRAADETYWQDFRTTPKVFLSLPLAQELWGTRFGDVTSIRMAPDADESLDNFANRYRTALVNQLHPNDVGMVLRSVRAVGMKASSGSTDFGGLFIAFSFFLLIAAGLLIGLLFRLLVETRAKQIGMMRAVGLTPRQIRGMLMLEGLPVALASAFLGLLGGAFFSHQMIERLGHQWKAAVNLPFIEFHWTLFSLAVGSVCAVILAMVSIYWGSGRLVREPIPALLRGGSTRVSFRQRGPVFSSPLLLCLVCLLGGGFIAVLGRENPAWFFISGFWLLFWGVAAVGVVLVRSSARLGSNTLQEWGGPDALILLGIRNAGRYPMRSLLTIGMIALATFVIVTVGAMRHAEPSNIPELHSGNGGFALVATSTVPLYQSLSTGESRDKLGISEETEAMIGDAAIYSLRVRPGEDASCLNIYQPTEPTILGVSQAFLRRDGFSFASTMRPLADNENPWFLLNDTFPDGAIPAIGDANTLQWILKVGVGQDLVIKNNAGQEIKLRIVAALAGSVFQGELLISDNNFSREFPNRSGFGYFLFETDPNQSKALAAGVRGDLVDYGLDVQTTAERIASFRAVENTYMGAFQTLGGLGLILGTFGLAAVLLRNILERQGEIGLLRAIGFSRLQLTWMLVGENVFLLIKGMAIGLVSGLVAVLPQQVPVWQSLLGIAGTLGWVLVAGIASATLASLWGLRRPLLSQLRAP